MWLTNEVKPTYVFSCLDFQVETVHKVTCASIEQAIVHLQAIYKLFTSYCYS